MPKHLFRRPQGRTPLPAAFMPLTASLILVLASAGASAQVAGQAPELQDWRAANDAVAQFKRGHIDLLKWESRNLAPVGPTAAVEPRWAFETAADAVRQAWRLHPDLVRVQNRLGAELTQRVAEGRLDAVDPEWHRRVDDMDEWVAIAVETRKAWIEAVAARKVLTFREAALTSAEAGEALGQRMVSVGNWSPLQATPFQLALSTARLDLRRAQVAAIQAENALYQRLKLTGPFSSLGLPSTLPELPDAAMSKDTWAQRLTAVEAQGPRVEGLRTRTASRLAFEVYSAGHSIAQISTDKVLKVRRFIAEETVLHYNGMLKSVWDLLGEVGNQAVAEVDAIDAQRDFWLAEADLQWTLQGGLPARFVSLGGASADASGPEAH